MERDGSSSHYGQPDNSSFSSNSENPTPENQDSSKTLPISSIVRLMKQILPKNARISDEAKEAIQNCVVEFIGFVTSEASEQCKREQRRTVTSDDLIWAMSSLGFDKYAELLIIYHHRIRYNDVAIVEHMVGVPLWPPRGKEAQGGASPYGGAFGPMGQDGPGGASGSGHWALLGPIGQDGPSGGGLDNRGDEEGAAMFDPLAFLNRDCFL